MTRNVRLTLRILMMGAVLESSLALAANSLYECHNESGKSLYTDSPAQLEQCKPVQFAQPHNVANPGNVAPQSEAPPAASTPAPAGNDAVSQTGNQGTSTENILPSPTRACPPGLNPLNPLSPPTCQQ